MVVEEEQEAGRLSPCSELLQQHVPFEENVSAMQDPRGRGFAREGGEHTEDTKDAKKQASRAKKGVEPKSRCRGRKSNLKQHFLSCC